MTIYTTRWAFIEPYVRGKKVLDIGPAELRGTTQDPEKVKWWLHGQIASAASSVVGLEKSDVQALALREMGYNIRHGDAESFDLGETFDVINAGELIEHLSNPGLFLESVKRHLKPDGFLVLTTPNRFSASHFINALLKNEIPAYEKSIAKHVFYFDEVSLRDLLTRHGFSQVTLAYCEWVGKPKSGVKSKVLNSLLRRFRPKFLRILLVAARQ